MKYTLLLILAAASCAFAQDGPKTNVMYQSSDAGAGPGPAVMTAGVMARGGAAVKGAPYSATITNESVQTLADGTHIVQSSSGSTARDSQGRTRQDAPLPTIGNLSAADAPHFVFLQDPVAGASYTLNLTDKTAWKGPVPPPGGGTPGMMLSTNTVFVHSAGAAPLPPPPPPPDPPAAST